MRQMPIPCLVIAAILFPVWRIQVRLHGRGYTWLSLGNCLCVVIALRETVRKIPPSSDLEVIPGYDETTTALIAIMRLRCAAPAR